MCIARTSTNAGHVLAVCATVTAIASRLVNDLEGYDRDAVETFADSLIGWWEFDYSAHVGAALDRLASAKLLTR